MPKLGHRTESIRNPGTRGPWERWPPAFLARLLHLSLRAKAAHAQGTVNGVYRRELEIVRGHIKPESCLRALQTGWRNTHQEITPTRRQQVARPIRHLGDCDPAAPERVLDRRVPSGLTKLQKDRTGVTVKDRSLQQLQRQWGQLAI